MVVRIRFGKGPKISRKRKGGDKPAAFLAVFLTPAVVMAWALGLWRIAAARKWTGGFAISSGVFSFWQTWLGLAAGLQLCAWLLSRRAKGADFSKLQAPAAPETSPLTEKTGLLS